MEILALLPGQMPGFRVAEARFAVIGRTRRVRGTAGQGESG